MRKRHGLKIKNFEAAVLYECQNGIRPRLDYTPAMFTNSLLQDFLLQNGLKVHKERSTRDIICVNFGFGTASYEDTVAKLEKQKESSETEEKALFFQDLLDRAHSNKDKFKRISADELRTIFYRDGITVNYGRRQTVKYKMFYRTPGKAKEGSCMFINQRLYKRAIKFIRMGINLPEEKAPIIEMSAYSSLVASTIVDRITIRPEEILIMKDVDSFSQNDVVSIETDENRHCVAKKIKDYKLKNTLFDGQALIDESIFPEWADGYILLRHHMTKCAAFSTKIQVFFKNHYKNAYDTAYVKDYWGRRVKVSDIKLITTENAVKFTKFGVSFDYWARKVRANGCQFGIVKTAHESKIGNLQRMSYQMVNAMDMASMKEIAQTSVDYVDRLKKDSEFFKDFLRKNANFCNDYEVLLALCDHNKDFGRCDYFKERRWKTIAAYAKNFKSGRLLQEADNLVIVGNPYGMLMHAVGLNPLDDPCFSSEEGAIQCWTGRFKDGEYLAEFRSPFNSRNNLGHLHNVRSEFMDKYCNIGKQCIAINMIGTDFQDRNNGSIGPSC